MIRESDSSSSDEEATAGTIEKKTTAKSHGAYNEVTEITPQLNAWKIKGRVERISRLHPTKNNGQVFHFGLRDKSGIIRIVAFANQAQKFFNVIQQGQFYTLKDARVTAATRQDRIYPLNHEIVISQRTQIQKVDAEPDFPGTYLVGRTMLKETQNLNHGSAIDVEAIIRKEWETKELKGGLTKKELEVFDESMEPGETMKLALWNDDTELTKSLDLKGFYYKISVQHATTNIYNQEISINTTKSGTIVIKKVEPTSHESKVITNWKKKRKKYQMTPERGNTARAAPTTRAANQQEINNTTVAKQKSNTDKMSICESNQLKLFMSTTHL